MPLSDFEPAVDDVAVKVLARTRDRAGHMGAFNANTNPTLEQVEKLIAAVALRVQAAVGPNLDDSLSPLAKETVAAGVAMQIELSLQPEAASAADSAFAEQRQLYRDGLETLVSTTTGDPADVEGFGSVPVASSTAAAYRAALDGFDPFLPPA